MEEEKKTQKSPHVLVFPYPGQGHINPMLQFCKRLVPKGVKITLVTTIYIYNSIRSSDSYNTTYSMTIEPISDGFDEGGYASADSSETYLEIFREVGSKSLADLIKKLDVEGKPVDVLVYDGFSPWAFDVAMAFGIDGAVFFTQACAVNNIYYHVYKGFLSLPLVPGATVSVPGLPQLEYWETPSFVHNHGPYPGFSSTVFNQFSNVDQARWVFCNTFYELEEEVIEWMRKLWQVRTIGPTLPSMYLDKRLEDDKDYGINMTKPNRIECMNWLNDKPKGSVVYVSFGSLAELGAEQMEEIAWGLKKSKANYLWVVRASEMEKLPKDYVDEKTENGLIVSWSPQLEVLAHESTGCFVTHCGFNSVLEAISLGVPVVAVPQWTDQTTNAKYMEDVWGVGVRTKRDEKGVVRQENLAWCIKEIMEGEKGKEIKKNARKWRDLAKEAIDEGGSSDKNIDAFIAELKQSF